MRKTLTDRSIAALKPKPKRFAVADPALASHYVRVAPTGAKSFVCVAIDPRDRRQVWATLGTADVMKIADARERARTAIRRIKDGLDPFETPPPRAKTFDSVAEDWLKRHVRAKGLRSEPQLARLLNVHIYPAWKGRAFAGVRRSDVAALLDDIADKCGPHEADRTLSVIRSVMNWHANRDDHYVPATARGMRRTSGTARERILDDGEIRSFWLAAEAGGPYGAMLQLLLLTGQRRDKMATLRWDDIDGDGVWTIRTAPREKGNALALQLPPLALEIIRRLPRVGDNPHVFAGRGTAHAQNYSRGKVALDARLGDAVKPWRVHDLRRTARSLLSRVVRPDIAERVLGHAIGGVAGIYDRHRYHEEKADALRRLAGLIDGIVHLRENVTPMKRAERR